MATVAELNVQIGARIKALQDGLKDAERSLRNSGRKFASIGSELTSTLSVPLGLIGGYSVKAAGDIESLTLALKSQLGSAEAARKEYQLLIEAAKNPGIGLEEAVQASVRLQGVGFSAESARKTIIELGNALASTGGTAEDLSRVTRQFAQMTSKGRVMQEDITVIAESMPAISGLMQKAFGTANVEAIRAMGIGGKEFVEAITAAAKELPRVEGGIKNSIGNALDAIKQAAARVGEAINRSFDIAGNAEKFANFLISIAEGFANLNPVIQSTIVYFGGLLLAIGPVMKVVGSMQLLLSLTSAGLGAMGGALKAVSGYALLAQRSFLALSTAMKATVILSVVTAVVLLADSFGAFNRELTANEKAQKAVNNVELEAKKSIAGEKAEVDRLIGVINSEVTSRDAKARAIENLKKISPEYFGQLKLEGNQIVGLTAAYDKYVEALLKSARVQAAKAKLVEIESELLDIEDRRLEKTKEAASVSAFFTGSTQTGLQRESDLYQQQINDLTAKKEALAKVVIASEEVTQSTDKSTAKTYAAAGAIKEASKQAAVLKEVLSDIANERARQDLLGAKDIEAEAQTIENGLKKLLDNGFSPTSRAVQNLKQELQGLFGAKPANFDQLPTRDTPTSVSRENATSAGPKTVDTSSIDKYLSYSEKLGEVNTKLQEGILGFNAAFAETARLVQEEGTKMQQVLFAVATGVSEAAASGASSFKELALAAVSSSAKIVRSLIQEGVAAAVSKALKSLPFPANLAAGAIAGGLAAGLFTGALNKIGVPKFANGTNYAQGGLAMVGERGRELVQLPRGSRVYSAPQTQNIMQKMSGQNITVSGTLIGRGTDLVAVVNRVTAKQDRVF